MDNDDFTIATQAKFYATPKESIFNGNFAGRQLVF